MSRVGSFAWYALVSFVAGVEVAFMANLLAVLS